MKSIKYIFTLLKDLIVIEVQDQKNQTSPIKIKPHIQDIAKTRLQKLFL